jgi:hypothetical protein
MPCKGKFYKGSSRGLSDFILQALNGLGLEKHRITRALYPTAAAVPSPVRRHVEVDT